MTLNEPILTFSPINNYLNFPEIHNLSFSKNSNLFVSRNLDNLTLYDIRKPEKYLKNSLIFQIPQEFDSSNEKFQCNFIHNSIFTGKYEQNFISWDIKNDVINNYISTKRITSKYLGGIYNFTSNKEEDILCLSTLNSLIFYKI